MPFPALHKGQCLYIFFTSVRSSLETDHWLHLWIYSFKCGSIRLKRVDIKFSQIAVRVQWRRQWKRQWQWKDNQVLNSQTTTAFITCSFSLLSIKCLQIWATLSFIKKHFHKSYKVQAIWQSMMIEELMFLNWLLIKNLNYELYCILRLHSVR